MAKKYCRCVHLISDHDGPIPPPRKPKSVGVKAWGVVNVTSGKLLEVARSSKLIISMTYPERAGYKPVPVMIVPCREGKRG